MRVLAISGSLRADSQNSRLLRESRSRRPRASRSRSGTASARSRPYDDDEDHELAPAPVHALRRAIAEADGLLFATPEYNSSIPGVLKNAIDWASRPRESTPLQGKPAAVMGATTGQFGAVWAQAELRKVLGSTRRPRRRPRAAGRERRRRLSTSTAGYRPRRDARPHRRDPARLVPRDRARPRASLAA